MRLYIAILAAVFATSLAGCEHWDHWRHHGGDHDRGGYGHDHDQDHYHDHDHDHDHR